MSKNTVVVRDMGLTAVVVEVGHGDWRSTVRGVMNRDGLVRVVDEHCPSWLKGQVFGKDEYLLETLVPQDLTTDDTVAIWYR